ncbi:hypothetical protein Bbelb_396000, partial [Branchiostoma belcheri]
IVTSAGANLQETTVANSATTGQRFERDKTENVIFAMTKRIGSDMHLHLTAMLGHGGASSKPHTLPRATEADGQARPRQEPTSWRTSAREDLSECKQTSLENQVWERETS